MKKDVFIITEKAIKSTSPTHPPCRQLLFVSEIDCIELEALQIQSNTNHMLNKQTRSRAGNMLDTGIGTRNKPSDTNHKSKSMTGTLVWFYALPLR